MLYEWQAAGHSLHGGLREMKKVAFGHFLVGSSMSLFLLAGSGAHAQVFQLSSTVEDSAQPSRPAPFTPYGSEQIVYDLKYVANRPFKLDLTDGLWIGGTAAVAGSLYGYREDIRDQVQDHRSESRSDFLNDVRTMGKGAFAPSLALAAFGASFLTQNNREKETALLLIESAALSQVGAFAGQTILASERPPDDSVRVFHYRGHGVSGDAALAASVIPPLQRQYLKVAPHDSTATVLSKWLATGLLYAGATLTAYQRVDSDSHWAPDAFLGMMTGLAVGNVLCEAHDKARPGRGQSQKQPWVLVTAMPGGVMVTFRY
jgi:hypothetical protein